MNKYNLIDFCWLLRDAVRFSQPWDGRDCMELMSFRFITSPNGQELTRENMDAYPCDKGRPFFYSKHWEANSFSNRAIIGTMPTLFVFQEGASRKKALEQNVTRKEITIGVVDRYSEDCEKGNCQGCSGRPIQNILQDTEDMLAQVLKYLGDVGYYEYETEAGVKTGLFNRALLAEQVAIGQVVYCKELYPFDENIYALNQAINLQTTYFPADKIYGTQTSLLVDFADCEIPEYCWNTNKYQFDR